MAILRSGDIVFDVGANIGYPTILFSQLVGVTGKVFALEPSPRAFHLLQRTLAGQSNVECLNLAASYQAGIAQFYETESLDTSSLEPSACITPYAVTTSTLDQLVDRLTSPTFVKIDVEGHEPSVFKGMKRLLQQDVPPILLFEGGYGCLPDTLAQIDRFAKGRYAVFGVKVHGTLTSLNDRERTNNYLAVPGWARSRIDGLLANTA